MILLPVRGRTLIVFLILFLLNSFCFQTVTCQVVIGGSGPVNEGSLLDLKENHNLGANATKGLLLPRVALESPSLMSPILNDDNLGKGEKIDHAGLVVYNVSEDYRVKLCKGVYVWTPEFNWIRIPEPCCFQLKILQIENVGLSFVEAQEATFKAIIMGPMGLEDSNIEYEWFLDGVSLSERSQNPSMKYTVGMADNGRKLSVRAYNKCSEIDSEPRALIITSRCIPIEQVSINNSMNKSDFRFASNKLVSFSPSLSPVDASDSQYKWEFGSVVSYDQIFTHEITRSGTLKLTVSNDCSSVSVSNEVAIQVFDCSSNESSKYTVFPTTNNQSQYTFTITELAAYTKDQLANLGITIQWYQKKTRWDGVEDDQFIPIAGGNNPSLVFSIDDALLEGINICNIGAKILGDEAAIASIMNCPIKNGRSYYTILTINGDEGNSLVFPLFIPTLRPW